MARTKGRSPLAVLDVLLVVAAVIAGLVAIAPLFDAVTSEEVSQLAIDVPAEDVGESLPSGLAIDKVEALVDVPTGLGFRLAWWLVGAGSSLLVVAGALQLRQIVVTARASDPFVADNVRRLRIVALLTVGHGVLALSRPAVAVAIQKDMGVEHASASASGLQLALAVVLFALEEIWQRGVALRDEQALTV